MGSDHCWTPSQFSLLLRAGPGGRGSGQARTRAGGGARATAGRLRTYQGPESAGAARAGRRGGGGAAPGAGGRRLRGSLGRTSCDGSRTYAALSRPGARSVEQTRQPPGSHTCGAPTRGCRPTPPPGRSPPSAAGPAPCPEAKPRPLCARSAVSGVSGSIALALLSCAAARWGALGGTFFTPGPARRSRLGFGEGKK